MTAANFKSSHPRKSLVFYFCCPFFPLFIVVEKVELLD